MTVLRPRATFCQNSSGSHLRLNVGLPQDGVRLASGAGSPPPLRYSYTACIPLHLSSPHEQDLSLRTRCILIGIPSPRSTMYPPVIVIMSAMMMFFPDRSRSRRTFHTARLRSRRTRSRKCGAEFPYQNSLGTSGNYRGLGAISQNR